MERPILFTGEMVRAILGGGKTETRRVVKPQPKPSTCEGHPRVPVLLETGEWGWDCPTGGDIDGPLMRCPYGVPGDLLWVRERWRLVQYEVGNDCAAHVLYSDGAGSPRLRCPRDFVERQDAAAIKRGRSYVFERDRPSIHMPKWAARIWLRVEDVRVERVTDITPEAVRREGVRDFEGCTSHQDAEAWDPIDAFASLWDHIKAARGYPWDADPWVWVVRFSRATPDPTTEGGEDE